MRPVFTSRLSLAALLLGLSIWAGVLTGCQSVSEPALPKPPDYLKVQALGQADPAAFVSPDPLSASLTGSLTGWASAARATAGDPLQSEVLAQAAARRQALRQLGKAILTLKGTDGKRAGERFAGDPAKLAALTQLLETQAPVRFEVKADTVEATAAIDGKNVADCLLAGLPAAGGDPLSRLAPAQLDELNGQAQKLALEQARSQLGEAVRGIELTGGQTAGQLMERDTSFANEIQAQMFILQPDDIEYPAPGSCRVTLFFDRNAVRELAARRQPWYRRLLNQ
jgi:hypothetical protein